LEDIPDCDGHHSGLLPYQSQFVSLQLVQNSPGTPLLDHVIVVNERHLKRLMNEFISYYHVDRTHLGLGKETPARRKAEENPTPGCRVVSMPRLGGLHHRYRLAA
jgi:hypothetical protein